MPNPRHYQDYDRSMLSPLSLAPRDAPRRLTRMKEATKKEEWSNLTEIFLWSHRYRPISRFLKGEESNGGTETSSSRLLRGSQFPIQLKTAPRKSSFGEPTSLSGCMWLNLPRGYSAVVVPHLTFQHACLHLSQV